MITKEFRVLEYLDSKGIYMSPRTIDWNIGLAKNLRNNKFARLFIEAALDEGMPIQFILSKVVRAYGVKEFAAKIKMPSSNLLRSINPKHNPTIETVNKILKPFSLVLTVGPRKSNKTKKKLA